MRFENVTIDNFEQFYNCLFFKIVTKKLSMTRYKKKAGVRSKNPQPRLEKLRVLLVHPGGLEPPTH